jgi:hypothetical protein
MITIEEFRTDVGNRGKSFLMTVADIFESASKQNLAVADDFADFAVRQLRMPTKAKSFGEYRHRTWDAYSQFGTDLREHGKDMYELWREVPGQIVDSLKAREKKVRKAAPKKAAPKKAAPKKAKKASPRKSVAKEVAAKPIA